MERARERITMEMTRVDRDGVRKEPRWTVVRLPTASVDRHGKCAQSAVARSHTCPTSSSHSRPALQSPHQLIINLHHHHHHHHRHCHCHLNLLVINIELVKNASRPVVPACSQPPNSSPTSDARTTANNTPRREQHQHAWELQHIDTIGSWLNGKRPRQRKHGTYKDIAIQ
jgi:hypothetical protein